MKPVKFSVIVNTKAYPYKVKTNRFGGIKKSQSLKEFQRVMSEATKLCLPDGFKPTDKPLSAFYKFHFAPPLTRNYNRLSQADKDALITSIHHTETPDTDNLVKAVQDALTGLVFIDDSQIALIQAQKIWDAHDIVSVSIAELS